MMLIDAETMRARLPFRVLIPALEEFLKHRIEVAPRQILSMANPAAEGVKGHFGIMPAWVSGRYLGVKVVTSFPHNRAEGKPTMSGTYSLFDASDGRPLAILDGAALTALRTAAGSAIAANRLARQDAKILLVVGTGTLAPDMVRAHAAVRSYGEILIWGRRPAAAVALARLLASEGLPCEAASDLSTAASVADVISSVTNSRHPLVLARDVRPGCHVDLVGGFHGGMREADDDLFRNAQVVVDSFDETAQSGDIAGPIAAGTLSADAIISDLAELVRNSEICRASPAVVTIYKSSGLASLDLGAAVTAYHTLVGCSGSSDMKGAERCPPVEH